MNRKRDLYLIAEAYKQIISEEGIESKMQGVLSKVKISTYLMGVSNQAGDYWQQQDFKALKKLRYQTKVDLNISDNIELDKIINTFKGSIEHQSLPLLKTSVLGN
jgi:hypothetical protein